MPEDRSGKKKKASISTLSNEKKKSRKEIIRDMEDSEKI